MASFFTERAKILCLYFFALKKKILTILPSFPSRRFSMAWQHKSNFKEICMAILKKREVKEKEDE
jgi:hypothetical protein